jgi:DNA-binding Lrp family transcriptional regulator
VDELDVKIFTALISESAVGPSRTQVRSSLRDIALRLGVDDITMSYRYKRLQKSGALSVLQLVVNSKFFGCRLLNVTVDVSQESAKHDMIRKLNLANSVITLSNFRPTCLSVLPAKASFIAGGLRNLRR